jgi:hypothetical protein
MGRKCFPPGHLNIRIGRFRPISRAAFTDPARLPPCFNVLLSELSIQIWTISPKGHSLWGRKRELHYPYFGDYNGQVSAAFLRGSIRSIGSRAAWPIFVEALDARGVSFVSVTQQFNTTTSMAVSREFSAVDSLIDSVPRSAISAADTMREFRSVSCQGHRTRRILSLPENPDGFAAAARTGSSEG